MVWGKRVAIFDRVRGRNSAPRDGQKIPWVCTLYDTMYVHVK